MGVHVGTSPVGAFVAIIVAVVLIIGVVIARRRGQLQSRGAVIAVAVIVALLIVYGMTGGFIPKP
jgi:hypothetical protein